MTFTELASPEDVTDFLNANSDDGCIVTFSATWCGPCRASKPELQALASKSPIPIGYVHEEDLGDFLDVMIQIKAFPTYVFFRNGQEEARVEGVNFVELEQMIQSNVPTKTKG